MSIRPSSWSQGQRIVAIGGGHGLAASLQALRRYSDHLTAVVGVADDGGSSGRLRAEFQVPPPGDLRMALAALCGTDPVGRAWARMLQFRFQGDGDLGGHAVGNLLMTALWQQTGDVVAGLEYLSGLVDARGTVLPTTTTPMTLVAQIADLPGLEDGEAQEVIGQANVARSGGRVVDFHLEPKGALGCAQSVKAIRDADVIVMGPGSWFTSVLPHFEINDIRSAFASSKAKRILVMNLQPMTDETAGFSQADHLRILANRYPTIQFDWVMADPRAVADTNELIDAAHKVGAEVHFERMATPATSPVLESLVHNPDLLAAAFDAVLDRDRFHPWQ